MRTMNLAHLLTQNAGILVTTAVGAEGLGEIGESERIAAIG